MPAFITNAVQVQRFADALYNVAVGTTTMAQVTAEITASGGLDNALNAYFANSFAGVSTTTVANTMCANLGIVAGSNGLVAADVTNAVNYIVGTLNAAPANARGAAVKGMLNNLASLTTDKVYGAVATKFNSDIDNAAQFTGNADVVAGTVVITPTPFALTTGADVFTGGKGADTFNALFNSTNGMTFGANDILDGGDGVDTLSIQVGTTAVAGPATLRNIENVTVNFLAAGSVNMLGATGVTSIESNGSSAAATFSNIGSTTPTIRVSNSGQDTTFGFVASALSGTADTLNLALSAVSAGTVTLNGGAIETLNVASSGGANTLTNLVFGTAGTTRIVVTGDQALNFSTNALPVATTVFDASGSTASGAGITATFGAVATATTVTGGTGNDSFNITAINGTMSVSGGAGNDTITDTSALRTTDSIDGGAGTGDVLSTTAVSAEGYIAPTVRTITGFEQLTLSTAGTGGVTLTAANVDTGITRVNIAGTAGTYGVTGPAGTFDVRPTAALGGTLTLTSTGTATTDSVSLTAPATGAVNVFAGQNLTVSKYETLTVATGTASTAAQTLGTIGITADTGGTSALRFTGVNNISIGAATAVSIDASGMTGAGTFTQTAAAGTTTTSITGTANNDTILGGTAASSLTGGAGNDSITGGIGNDTINGGDGADQITGGVGRDSLTGGSGIDTFVFAANAAGAVVSSQSAPDTITDFTSGTDKLQIAQTITAFLGNFTTLSSAQAAVVADTRANLAFFVTSENTLYVTAANTGIPVATDTVITLQGVTSLASTDFGLGSQGTGATLTLTAAAANLSNTASTNSSGVTAALDETINSTAAFLVLSSIDGGAGNDTLNITSAPGTTLTSLTNTSPPTGAQALVNNVERVVFQAGIGTFQMQDTANLAVSNTSATAGVTALTMGAGAGQSFTSTNGVATAVTLGAGVGQSASISGGAATNSITLGGAGQSATITGIGSNTITTSQANALGSTFIGGAGTSDTLAINSAGTVTLAATAAPGGAAAFSGIDTVTLTGISTLNVTPTAALAVTQGAGATTVNGTGTGGTITVTGNGTTQANLLTLTGTSNFAVTTVNANNSGITDTGTGTLTVTTTSTYAGAIASSTASLVTLNLAATTTGVPTFGGTSNLVVNGLGTATTTGGYTEINTHTGAAVTSTFNVSGALASAITLAGAAGTVTVNDSHTGVTADTAVTTLATSTLTGRVINVTLSGATGDFTVTGSNPTTITETAGRHLITGGTGSDTIVGFSGIDTLVGGIGADRITTGGGADIINETASQESVITGIAVGTALPVQGQVLNLSGVDTITGVTTGVAINFVQINANSVVASTTYPIVTNGGTLGNAASNNLVRLLGDYVPATGLFTVNTGGASTLLAVNTDGIITAGVNDFVGVILVGYIDTGAADTFASAAGQTTTSTYTIA